MTTKQPQDRLPKKSAQQREAEGDETVTITWRDMKFEVPTDVDDWTVEGLLGFEEGKAAVGVRGVLGPKQFAQFMASKPKPRGRDLANLFDSIASAVGFEPGESGASSD